MKKFLATILGVGTLFLSATFTGCDFPIDIFGTGLKAPEIKAIGNTVYREPVEEAEKYEIFINKESFERIAECYTVLENITENVQVYVIAKKEENEKEKRSAKSNSVLVYQNADFPSEKILDLNISGGGKTIPATVSYVTVTGSFSSASILIADRNSDLVISLTNVNMTSPEGKSCISTAGVVLFCRMFPLRETAV